MKKILLLLLLASCSVVNKISQKESFITQFFNNEAVFNTLNSVYSNDKVIIYDKDKVLTKENLKFLNNTTITTEKPNNKNYFIIHRFILDKKLSLIVLAKSDREFGIIFYCAKLDNTNNWTILNIIPKNSR